MTDQNTSIAITGNHGGLMPQNFEGLWNMAKIFAQSGMMPKGLEKPEAVFTAVQYGLEVGLSPMQAVQNIAVVNGRPTIWGDAMLGLVRGSGKLAKIQEEITGDGDKQAAICRVWRVGEEEPVVSVFSMSEARHAGLSTKPGPWSQYPRRMLQMRARSFALRDMFPDVLKGLHSREEAQDIRQVDGEVVERAPNPLKAMRDAAPVNTDTGEILSAPADNGQGPIYQYRAQLAEIADTKGIATLLLGLPKEIIAELKEDIAAARARVGN